MRYLLVITCTIHIPTAPNKLLNGLLAFKSRRSDRAPCKSIIGCAVPSSVMPSNFPPGRDCHRGPRVRDRRRAGYLIQSTSISAAAASQTAAAERQCRTCRTCCSCMKAHALDIALCRRLWVFSPSDTWRRRGPFWPPSSQHVCVRDGRNIWVTGSGAVYRDGLGGWARRIRRFLTDTLNHNPERNRLDFFSRGRFTCQTRLSLATTLGSSRGSCWKYSPAPDLWHFVSFEVIQPKT